MKDNLQHIISKQIEVKGLVQGIGFRPFIYRLANKYEIYGKVYNTTGGVAIKAEGDYIGIINFVENIKKEAPVAAEIQHINVADKEIEYFKDFQIENSHDVSGSISEISPDIAVCNDCLDDLLIQEHRVDYAFINCTNCGPRFSIVKDFPYDRINTTMDTFQMCDICKNEYEDILNRRFHAQPVACNDCGPQYTLHIRDYKTNNIHEILIKIRNLLEAGCVIAIKGIGGYHLMCDARNQDSVNKLRRSKHREGKPFAVMFPDIESIRKIAEVSAAEKRSLTSWKRPIVLLKSKNNDLAKNVCIDFNTIGAFLPYMPFHHLLFSKLIRIDALVLTSGNLSEEPILIDNEEALKNLAPIADAVITYNREIYNRTDDSVVKIVNDKERIFRRSRGYAPNPVYLKDNTEGIFAAGAELVNCFCIGKGNQAILSQHIGDLKNFETFEFYKKTFETFKKVFRFQPSLIVTDLHPDYLSTRFGEELNMDTMKVQHHYAHIASCMVENEIDEPVIGISFDGTGLGDDNTIWGSEFLIADLNGYKRLAHFEYIELPGGDKATYEPWRIAVSYLYKIYGKSFLNLKLPFLNEIPNSQVNLILQAIDKKINCPVSCSAGRLFDAVSALINCCTFSKFHAEAPMRLESIVTNNLNESYGLTIAKEISFLPVIEQIVTDIKNGIKKEVISATFHNTVINSIIKTVENINKETGIKKLALSGGTFQNSYLLTRLENLLGEKEFEVFTQNKIPCNDGGIALGQLAIAARKLKV